MSTQLFGTASTDVTWLFNDSSTWTAVETNIGIVSGVFSLCLEKNLESFLAESQLSCSLPAFPPPRAHGMPGQVVENKPTGQVFQRHGGQLQRITAAAPRLPE